MVKRGVFFFIQLYCMVSFGSDDLGLAVQRAFADQAEFYGNVVQSMTSKPETAGDQIQTLKDLAVNDNHTEMTVQLISTNAE